MKGLSLTDIAIEVLQINDDWFNHVSDIKKIRLDDFELYTFVQMWGNTSGGFEGMGGSAMTNQNTYVLFPLCKEEDAIIYFGGVFAYKAPISRVLIDDIRRGKMAGKRSNGKYFKEVK